MVGLSDAIGAAAKTLRKHNQAAFTYRGADLGWAIERAAYIHLINDPALLAAFEARRSGEPGEPPVQPHLGFDETVGRLLLDQPAGQPRGRRAERARHRFER